MEEYTVITQGNAIYLEGKLGDEEQLDEVDRGMLVSNQISGFLPLSVQWVNGNCRLLYNITGLTPLEQAARILENETRLTNFFLSLCKAEKECAESAQDRSGTGSCLSGCGRKGICAVPSGRGSRTEV